MHYTSSSPMRLNYTSAHWIAIAASLLRLRICVFLSHLFVCWCFIIRPSNICILHKSQWGSHSFPFFTTTTCEKKM